MKQRKIGDSQQKVGPLEWTENVNKNKMTQNQVPSTQRWISGLDYDGPHIFGFFIFWIFLFLDNVLSGILNTVTTGEGASRYFARRCEKLTSHTKVSN
jgi:hypothetical protein